MISRKYWILTFALSIFILNSLVSHSTKAQAGVQPELPRTLLDTTYIAPTGNTLTVAAGGNLQAALNAARRYRPAGGSDFCRQLYLAE
jgi:hypothetical protein